MLSDTLQEAHNSWRVARTAAIRALNDFLAGKIELGELQALATAEFLARERFHEELKNKSLAPPLE